MLSLCMIVKNEAVALPRCLTSVQTVVDEIVVLDTGSSDRTPEVAQAFGARVYEFAWCNDFSAARNQSLKHAQGEWILVLDADEVLVADVIPILKQAVQSPDHLLINLLRQEVGAEQSPYSLVSRLFRHHPAIYFSRPYHAMVDDSISQLLRREPQWRVGQLSEVAILHEGYQATAIAEKQKFQKAQLAMEGFLANHPTDPYVCSKLGALYVQTGELQRGITLLQQGLTSLQEIVSSRTAPHFSLDNRNVWYELYYHLGIAHSHLSHTSEAETYYRAALQQPIDPKLKLGAYNNWANLLKANGNLSQSKAIYETILQVDPTFAVGYYNLGLTLKALGDLRGAIAAYQQAINLNPNYAEAYQNLGVARLKMGDLLSSLEAFRQAIVLHEQQSSGEAGPLRQGLQEMGFQV